MIEATCTACGNINRIGEGDVPIGAKFTTCASCKSRVAIPTKTTSGTGPIPTTKTAVDLIDLPAPKRPSPLGPEPSRAPPRSGLAAAHDREPPSGSPRPHSPSAPGALELDEVMGFGDEMDLPAPRGAMRSDTMPDPEPGISDLPAPKGPRTIDSPVAKPKPELSDLPAPKPRIPIPRIPTPPAGAAVAAAPPRAAVPPLASAKLGGLEDLPAPRPTREPAKFAPSTPRGRGDLPGLENVDLVAPKPSAITDLVAPKSVDVTDLPAPKPSAIVDLPAPKPSAIVDLPAPKPSAIADLPAPRAARPGAPSVDLPDLMAPRTDAELPAPKSLFDDLPQPAGEHPVTRPELPAPKGFFDDLPQPAPASKQAKPELPAPKGFFDDLPRPAPASKQAKPELPAPKGFFDDLPGRVNPSKQQPPEVPAPKGFFDDLPGRVNPSKQQPPEVPAPKGFFDDLPGRVNPSKQQPPEVPAPKGFFDDLPGRVNPSKQQPPEVPAPKGFFDDLPQPRTSRPNLPTAAEPLVDLSAPVEIDTGPELDLDADAAELEGLAFTSPPLPAPPPPDAPAGAPVRIAAPRTKAESQAPEALGPAALATSSEVAFELEQPRAPAVAPKRLAPKRSKAPSFDPIDVKRRARRLRIVGVVAVVLAASGGAGVFMYRRHLAQQERAEEIARKLQTARTALASKDAKHWDNAARAANQVLDLDGANAEALGIAAESLFADGLANGVNAQGKFGQARKLLATALENGANNPSLERAQALSSITAIAMQPERALTRLQPLVARAPKDATLALYLGWAHEANGDTAAAIKAFTDAMASEQVRVPALYGRARSKLLQADIDGARGDFTAVLEIAKDHLGAQVGLAAAQPAAQAQQREADLLAILERKDLAAGDPRAVVLAWSLAAEAARHSGRLDVARDRYTKALKLAPQDIGVLAGLAEVELRDGKLELASETITKALTLSANDFRAQLVAAEISIKQKRLEDAETRVQALAVRTPPPPPLEMARIKMVTGMLLDARGNAEPAVDAYVEAARLAGELDLTPSLTAVAKLGVLAEAAAQAKEPERAAELRARAEQLIATLADNAQKDPQLALTLGTAYLQAGDAPKAEPWLRRVVDVRPSDPEAQYQLAKALARLDRVDDAIERLRRAVDLAPARVEIALELGRTYEASARDTAANELYTKLLAATDPVTEVRVRAGRFYARTQQIAKAAEQGTKILELEPLSAAGLYLKAEGLLATGKTEEAARLFRQAVDQDRDPQYLDGQGRAAEAMVVATGDTKFQDVALRAYIDAAALAPAMFNPQVGQGRLYVTRHEAKKAVTPLVAAHHLRPEDAQVAKLLGLAYKELQETKVAIEWLARSYKFQPDAETAWSLGQLLVDANQPAAAVVALANATRLALEDEKQTGKPISWLTDALHKLGRINLDQGNESAAKAAWEKYVARNPKAGAQLDEVRRLLATTLQSH